ncbi:MAG: hypothetical protein AB7K24_06980 [Gemmataceae bacterium]
MIDERLDRRDRLVVENHVEDCPRCIHRLERMTRPSMLAENGPVDGVIWDHLVCVWVQCAVTSLRKGIDIRLPF